jgi:hypothetical protein
MRDGSKPERDGQAGISVAGRRRGGPVSTRRPRPDAVVCVADCAAIAVLGALAVRTGGWGGAVCWLLAVAWTAVFIAQIRLALGSRGIRRP